jgi:hypothetical protein
MLTHEGVENYSAAYVGRITFLLRCLEVASEFGEARKLQELLTGWGLVDNLVLKHPGEVMGDEDSVQTG